MYGPVCVLVFAKLACPAPPEGDMVGWLELVVWWNDSTGAQQGQLVHLHLWPFCSFTTWPLTVFMCYMTRISEPRPFRAACAADSVFTVVSREIGMSLTCLTCPASGQITAGFRSTCEHTDGFFLGKEERGFVVALIHSWHCANERKNCHFTALIWV